MDTLRRDDIERIRRTPPAQRLAQALDTMQAGIRLKRAALAHRHPEATPAEIDAVLCEWLQRED